MLFLTYYFFCSLFLFSFNFSDEDSSESKRVRFYVVFVLNKNENGKVTRLDISMVHENLLLAEVIDIEVTS